jgi:hypothetical protein
VVPSGRCTMSIRDSPTTSTPDMAHAYLIAAACAPNLRPDTADNGHNAPMTTVSEPAAPPAPLRPARPSDVIVALLLIAAELVLGWFLFDIGNALEQHLNGPHPVQWFYLMLPSLPLALVVSLHAIRPGRALAAAVAALGAGVATIAQYELVNWIFTHHPAASYADVVQAIGYVTAMTVATLAALAWGLSRRHGRTWPVGLLVAAAGAALTLWTNWPSHTGWGHTEFVGPDGFENFARRFELLHTVALMLPIVASCVVCWLVDVTELRRPAPGPAYDDEGPPPR